MLTIETICDKLANVDRNNKVEINKLRSLALDIIKEGYINGQNEEWVNRWTKKVQRLS